MARGIHSKVAALRLLKRLSRGCIMPAVRWRNHRELTRFAKSHAISKRLVEVHREALSVASAVGSPITKRIEDERQLTAKIGNLLIDGSLGESVPWDQGVTVAGAGEASRPPKHAAYLYGLIRALRPRRVLELGTNLGVSGSYIGAALVENGDGGRIVTMDASPYRQRIARGLFEKLGLSNVECVLGLFDQTFDPLIDEHEPFDFVFIDGNHQREPTLHYARRVCNAASEPLHIVFDDIRWSDGMVEAWNELRQDPSLVTGLDLYSMSLCRMDKSNQNQPLISKAIIGAFE